ncbi:olfactory receptor 5B21-like [Mauremys mutica]|uniref:olfactory receptor 5B21-like n=1 Tax=Mauremys reevesii TaxID=260615 RepID=UPI00193FD89B|nr:olfactory receptor 5B21-like [Mauremys reevesii]XP_044872586.1 olfactory receptor 5B21-like [Mauremys mutica]
MAAGGNGTAVTHFILLGLTNRTDLQGLLFGSFLLIYTVTLMGNLGMMALIHADPHLHTPMYFFLSTLSFVDVCYSSVVTPRLLADFLAIDKSISYTGCMAQMAFFLLHGTAECLLLATMAYDRFVAICRPLLYHTLMSRGMCIRLVTVAYTLSIANSAVQTSNVFRLPFCGPNHINDYFCDIPPLLQLVCSDTTTAKGILYIFSALATMTTLTIILVSYGYILVTVGRMSSAKGRRKALSTCASHFMAIFLFYGTVFFMYIKPRAGDSMDEDKVISVFYTIVIPMLNPLIYSLRNREVKDSLRRKICGKIFP